MVLSLVVPGWDHFFHSRVGDGACRLGGLLRIGFGLVFLWDWMILGLDLDKFYSPTHGILPLDAGRDSRSITPSLWTLLEVFPESDKFMWSLYGLGVLQGCLLVLGILPRFQAACLFVNIMSFQNHDAMFLDHHDVLFRIWCFFLLFQPLHRITIYDCIPSDDKKETQDSWPVWPFRMFQLQLTIMYLALSLNKLESKYWLSGEAFYWIKEDIYFVGGWVKLPELLFNRMLFLQLITWVTMGLEIACWITMWIPRLKRPTAYCMIGFYFIVDLTTNFHCLPWLAMLGWVATLFEEPNSFPSSKQQIQQQNRQHLTFGLGITPHSETKHSCCLQSLQPNDTPLELRLLADLFLVVLFCLICSDAFPAESLERMIFGSDVSFLSDLQSSLYTSFEPAILSLGLWQEVWNLYGGAEMEDYYRMEFSAILYRDNGEFGSPSIQTELWEGPRYGDMKTGWQRKRNARQMIYWHRLSRKSAYVAWNALGRHLAGQVTTKVPRDKPTVVGLELKGSWTTLDYPLAPLWSWSEPAQTEENMYSSWTSIMKIRYCTDVSPSFRISSSSSEVEVDFCDDCVAQPEYVKRYCRYKCEVCVDDFPEYAHDYLSYSMSEYMDHDCMDEESDEWDDEACPSYLYYRDFDPFVPRQEVSLIAARDKYLTAMESDLNNRPRQKGKNNNNEDAGGDKSKTNAIHLVESAQGAKNQTSALSAASRRTTVLKSA